MKRMARPTTISHRTIVPRDSVRGCAGSGGEGGGYEGVTRSGGFTCAPQIFLVVQRGYLMLPQSKPFDNWRVSAAGDSEARGQGVDRGAAWAPASNRRSRSLRISSGMGRSTFCGGVVGGM